MIGLSFKYRIALTVFVLTGAMAGVLLWHIQEMQREAAAAQQAASEAVIGDLLGELSRLAIIRSDYGDLEHHLGLIRQNPHVRKIVVADSENRVVASTDAGLLGLALPALRDSDAAVWKTRELTNAAGRQGLLAMEFSNSELVAAQRRIRTWAAAFAAVGMTLIALVSVLMGTALTRRLAVLEQASRRIGEGDFGSRTHMRGSDEVSALGQTLDAMAEKIQASMDDLQRLVSIVENSSDFIALADMNGHVLYVNEAGRTLVGVGKLHPVPGAQIADYLAEEDLPALRGQLMPVVLQAGRWIGEFRLRHFTTGELIPVEMTSFAIQDVKTGKPIALATISRDIRERRRAERALRHSEEQYRLVVENASEAIFIAQDGRLKFPNAALAKLLEYPPGELGSQPFSNFIHPEDRQMVLDRHRRRLQGEDLPGTYEFRVVTASGATRWVQLSVVRIEWEGRPATLNFLSDTTEKKALELQLRHAQKMEAVGQLAGGIAHDFNNMLSVVIGYGNVALTELPADEPVRADLEQILAAANRGVDLTRSLLAFSRKQPIDLQPVTVDSIIARIHGLMRRIIGEDIALRTALAAPEETVLADSGQIEQLLMNLATNSRDAMPNGGQLTIETGRTRIGDAFIRQYGYGRPGAYVLISFSDTGEGMDEPTRQRVFEPFFTTKEVGKGTGLGLAMAYGVVKQHDGFINVDSEPGKGTTFRIYLPVVSVAARSVPVAESRAAPKGGEETILLAEDDAAVRSLTRRLLEESGYTVIMALDGQDAVEQLARCRDRIDLLVVDVVMPRKNGKEVVEEAKRMKSGIKVLFTSGYPADAIQVKAVLEQGLSFISKPASPHDLLRKVREVLDR